MSEFSSYWLYERFEQRGSQEPIPVYPNTYSINGDGTMTPVVRNEDDTECGYVPPVEPTYRWTNIPITQDYICDECNTSITRWQKTDRTICLEEGEGKKFVGTYSGGRTLEVDCNDNPTLTSGETQPGGYVDGYGMTTAVIGNCVTSFGNAFYNCVGLESITIPNSVTSIDSSAFRYCRSLKRMNSDVDDVCNIPSNITSIGSYAFAYCSGLTSVIIPSSIASIGYYAFWYCSGLTSVIISNGVTDISPEAFYECRSLTSITIPDSVTVIHNAAFRYCSSLASVTIGSGITTIADYAFNACTSLGSIRINATTPPILGGSTFGSTPIGFGQGTIYVPSASVNAYKSTEGWSEFASLIQPIP